MQIIAGSIRRGTTTLKRGEVLPEDEQISAIQKGALWPYIKEIDCYRCPTGTKGQMVTYAGMDGVNGRRRQGTEACFVTNKLKIKKTAQRMVFIDEGWVSPDSFAVHYVQET